MAPVLGASAAGTGSVLAYGLTRPELLPGQTRLKVWSARIEAALTRLGRVAANKI